MYRRKPVGLGRYPSTRMRRNRMQNWSRRLVAESTLTIDDLVWPLFIHDGEPGHRAVASMPGIDRLSIDLLVDAVGVAKDLGIPAVAIFPHIDSAKKTPEGREAYNPENLVCTAVRTIKETYPDIGVICDVALDPYSSDGHDGIMRDGEVLNDETIEALCKQAIVQAGAGCDVNAPSDMMDGRIGIIRQALDAEGYINTQLMSYAVKYASAFYGPFRDAVGTNGILKDNKKSYQMDPANIDEALREAALDINEGADMLMVKPGLSYLDVLTKVKTAFSVPTFAYNVSGEYAMLKAASAKGWLDFDKIIIEVLTAFKRAGADGIFTYAAIDVARKLKTG